MPPTDELKEKIIAELELGDLPPEKQREVVEGVAKNVFDEVLLTILEKLPDDAAREKFTAMAEAGDLVALKAFARTQIENFDAVLADIVQKEIEAHKG